MEFVYYTSDEPSSLILQMLGVEYLNLQFAKKLREKRWRVSTSLSIYGLTPKFGSYGKEASYHEWF